jgi:hypothetical protein
MAQKAAIIVAFCSFSSLADIDKESQSYTAGRRQGAPGLPWRGRYVQYWKLDLAFQIPDPGKPQVTISLFPSSRQDVRYAVNERVGLFATVESWIGARARAFVNL